MDKLRKIADAGLGVRGWLRKFAGKDKPEESEPTTNRVAKRSAKIWAGRALMAGRLTPQGLLGSLAIGAALEAAKTGAGKISDRIDQKMQEEFDKIAQRQLENTSQSTNPRLSIFDSNGWSHLEYSCFLDFALAIR